MEQQEGITLASRIMLEFAQRTGLKPSRGKSRRYLWTDAFAVCNFLALLHRTGEPRYGKLALDLAEQVHHVLGRYAEGDSRTGWISGLADEEGEKHPTRGGLRIGKPLPERKADEPISERLEWDRDGQYYHYLTKWMLALNRLSGQTGDQGFRNWAVELARSAHAGFTYHPPSGPSPRMYWKMSIDLTRPLVDSMGHHDPLDGLLTYLELQETQTEIESGQAPVLEPEITDMKIMCRERDWTTDDPLGLGGILSDGLRTAMLTVRGYADLEPLLLDLLEAAVTGLSSFAAGPTLLYPPGYRLAFRELGLSIGLHAAESIKIMLMSHPESFVEIARVHGRLEDVLRYTTLCKTIEGCWLTNENRQTESWQEHEDINTVMLATSLLPDGDFGRVD